MCWKLFLSLNLFIFVITMFSNTKETISFFFVVSTYFVEDGCHCLRRGWTSFKKRQIAQKKEISTHALSGTRTRADRRESMRAIHDTASAAHPVLNLMNEQ